MRIRTIKPSVFKDPDLWDLAQETGYPILQAFEGLWCASDREGRFEWKPRILKTDILPYWDGDFSRVLDALATRGFVVRYAVQGREYGVVRTFKRHQVVNNRELASVLPPPPENPEDTPPSTRRARVEHASSTRHDPAQAEGEYGRECGREQEQDLKQPPSSETLKQISEQPCLQVETATAAAPIDLERALAARGSQKLQLLGLTFFHIGKWQPFLAELARKPAEEWANAERVIRSELNSGKQKFITPAHLVEQWHRYSVGDSPGAHKREPAATRPGEYRPDYLDKVL